MPILAAILFIPAILLIIAVIVGAGAAVNAYDEIKNPKE